jgi:GNAT superfamily N-acetyltransferase
MEKLTIREAQPKDTRAIATLCNQLGYQAGSEDISLRLEQINSLDQQVVYLAELDQLVIGWVHVYVCPLLISNLQAQLGGLIVHDDHRGKDIGKRLMLQAEAWARSQGCLYVTVYTNIIRTDTHVFYDHLGYQKLKTEYVLRKEL